MTTLTIDPADVLSDVLTAVLSALTPSTEWALAPIDQPAQVSPWTDARAVVISTSGWQIAVLLDLASGTRFAGELPGALAAAAAAIAPNSPTAGAGDVDPGALVAAIADHPCAAAQLLDGGNHVATVLLIAVATPEAAAEATAPTGPAPHEFTSLEASMARPGAAPGLDLLFDVEMGVTAELGRTRMLVRDVLDLCPGSVIELDRAAGAPVDVLVNGMLIARGEVVVIDEEFGVRITEVIGYQATPRGTTS